MTVLVKQSLWDSVTVKEPVKRLIWFARLRCAHTSTTTFSRVDHRAGPGSFADNFEGVVCRDCGAVLAEVQTL